MRWLTDKLFIHFPGEDKPGLSTGLAICIVLIGIATVWPVQPSAIARLYWPLAPLGMLCVYVGFSILYWDTRSI